MIRDTGATMTGTGITHTSFGQTEDISKLHGTDSVVYQPFPPTNVIPRGKQSWYKKGSATSLVTLGQFGDNSIPSEFSMCLRYTGNDLTVSSPIPSVTSTRLQEVGQLGDTLIPSVSSMRL